MSPRPNTRLLWVSLAAIAWAYLGIAAALAQLGPGAGRGGPGLRLRLPPGAVHLPGRVVEVTEEPGRLRIVMAVRDAEAGGARGPDGEPVRDLPPGVEIEYVTESGGATTGRMDKPAISTLEGQDRPMRLPGGREVIVGQQFYLSLSREGVALIPHDGEGPRLMEGPLKRRGWGRGERPRDRLRDRIDERRGHGGDEGGAGQGHGGRRPPAGDGRPPEGERPPEGDRPPPPADGEQHPPDGERPQPPDGKNPPRDGERPPRDGSPPPGGGERPPEGGQRPPEGKRPPPGGNNPGGGSGGGGRPPRPGGPG